MTKHLSFFFALFFILLCCFPLLTETGEVKTTFPLLYSSSLQRVSNPTPSHTLFILEGISFQIPLEGISINDFLDRSIGYLPPDVIRDGLPAFGTQRDDWKGIPRLHEGYDIYIDNVNVLAASEGVVTKVAITSKAGLYIKVQHDNHLATVYVHLKRSFVNKYQKVQQGEIIGCVEGPTGNAISAQLHFEVQKDHHSLDPLPLIESFYENNNEITMKISQYKQFLLEHIRERTKKVKEFLRSH